MWQKRSWLHFTLYFCICQVGLQKYGQHLGQYSPSVGRNLLLVSTRKFGCVALLHADLLVKRKVYNRHWQSNFLEAGMRFLLISLCNHCRHILCQIVCKFHKHAQTIYSAWETHDVKKTIEKKNMERMDCMKGKFICKTSFFHFCTPATKNRSRANISLRNKRNPSHP